MSDADGMELRREQEEHEIRIIKFNATKWTVELAAQREMQAVRTQATERQLLPKAKHNIQALGHLANADMNVVAIRYSRRMEALRASIWREKFTAGPIYTLPVEILHEIFSHYVEFNLSPWRLVKVCKTWMQTALKTPQLWGRIQFTNYKPTIDDAEDWVVDGRRELSRGNVQLCTNLEQVNAAVTRSGAMPLDVTIQRYAHKVPNADIPSAIALLVNDPTSRRIRSLDIASADPLVTSIIPGQFPLLKGISWRGVPLPWVIHLFKMISATSNDLESAHLYCVLPPELVELPFWSRIRTGTFMNNSELDKVATKLTSLEGNFEGPPHWPNSYTRTLHWPKVRSLSVKCSPLNLANLHLWLRTLLLDKPWPSIRNPPNFANIS